VGEWEGGEGGLRQIIVLFCFSKETSQAPTTTPAARDVHFLILCKKEFKRDEEERKGGGEEQEEGKKKLGERISSNIFLSPKIELGEHRSSLFPSLSSLPPSLSFLPSFSRSLSSSLKRGIDKKGGGKRAPEEGEEKRTFAIFSLPESVSSGREGEGETEKEVEGRERE